MKQCNNKIFECPHARIGYLESKVVHIRYRMYVNVEERINKISYEFFFPFCSFNTHQN